MSKFRPEDRFCIGQNCTLYLPQWIDLEMIWCPPGKFIMGSPPDELGHCAKETASWCYVHKTYGERDIGFRLALKYS